MSATPPPGRGYSALLGNQFLKGETLVWEGRTRESHPFFVPLDVERLAVPWIARIVMKRVVRCQVPVSSVDIALRPDLFDEAG